MSMRTLLGLLATGVALPALSAPTHYTIDPEHTYPSFEAPHIQGISIWRGKLDKTSGTIVLDREAKTGQVDIVMDASSINFGHEKLNEHVKSADFFDVAKYPTMEFKSKKIEKQGDGYKMTGDLTMHGVTKEVTLNVDEPSSVITDPYGNLRRGFSASTTINRKDWGMTYNNLLQTGEAVVGDNIKIQIDVELVRKKS